MGIVNVTPDSFSDGGRHSDRRSALAHARSLIAAGADILDIGGESTRPGSEPTPAAEELARTIPLIEAIRAESAIPISIDTVKPEVARAAIAAGAAIWNDITALRGHPDSAAVAADLGCEVILMHMQGEPRTMQENPVYGDVVAEVRTFLEERARAAIEAGVAASKIWTDPGIGFGKRPHHNLALIAHLDRLITLGFPLVLGVSRKRFIRSIDATAIDTSDRIGGSLAAALAGVGMGARAVRVHDVRETVQALKMWNAVEEAKG